MHKKQMTSKLVAVRDRHGEELLAAKTRELIQGDRAVRPAATVREDLQAVRRRPLDAPMATRDEAWEKKADYRLDTVTPKLGVGRLVMTLLLMAASFIAGMAVGKLT